MIFAFMIELVGMLPKSFRAKVTLNRSFITVNQLVSNQYFACSKCGLAHFTFVRFFTSMNSLVLYQIITLTEFFLADITFVRFFSSMNSHMTLQICLMRKSFVADITFEWFFSIMNSHVTLQMWFSWKSFVADITFERFFSSTRGFQVWFTTSSLTWRHMHSVAILVHWLSQYSPYLLIKLAYSKSIIRVIINFVEKVSGPNLRPPCMSSLMYPQFT